MTATTTKTEKWTDGIGEELQSNGSATTVHGKQYGCFLVYRVGSWQCLHIPSSRGTGDWRTRELAKRAAVEMSALGDFSAQKPSFDVLCAGAALCRKLRREDDDSKTRRYCQRTNIPTPPVATPAPIPGPLAVGSRVRHSGYVTMQKRDYWNSCGSEPAKSRAKDALDACIAERGTITEVLHNGFKVQWDHGPVSQCLSYRVIPA